MPNVGRFRPDHHSVPENWALQAETPAGSWSRTPPACRRLPAGSPNRQQRSTVRPARRTRRSLIGTGVTLEVSLAYGS